METLLTDGQAAKALPLLKQLRDPMIEATEQDKFVKLLNSAIEKLPGNTEALEMLADFSRHTSDPFQLNSALSQLVDVYAAAGEQARAEHLMKELIDRNKGDERLIDRYNKLRKGEKGEAPALVAAESKSAPAASKHAEPVAEIEIPLLIAVVERVSVSVECSEDRALVLEEPHAGADLLDVHPPSLRECTPRGRGLERTRNPRLGVTPLVGQSLRHADRSAPERCARVRR